MAGCGIGGLLGRGLDLGQMIKMDGSDLLAGYVGAARNKLPHIADTMVDAFGRVLDIFEKPTNLRKPEFDTPALMPSQQTEIAEALRQTEVEVKPVSKPRINEHVRVEHLAEATRAQVDATQSRANGGDKLGNRADDKLEQGADEGRVSGKFEHRNVNMSASPCDAEARLCSACYLSLATVRCDSCVMHFCAVCAVERHSHGLNVTHKLLTATSGQEAKLTASDALSGSLSFGTMAAGPEGSCIGNLSRDLTIQIRSGETPYPAYDACAVHAGRPLRFTCVYCHLLPVCEQCASEAHSGAEHRIVEIEAAVAEVKELLGDCLAAVVRRHNDLSVVLPELHQLADTSNAGLKNATRSVRTGIQRALDAVKSKQNIGMREVRNMQQVGSAALNRMMHASGALSRYLKGCVSQLEAINRMNNSGIALNMFVDLRANFEKLLFTDEEIPDLTLEVPHWQIHCGNLPNLLADHETRINLSLAQIAALSKTLRCMVSDCVKSIERASSGKATSRPTAAPMPPRRHAERRTRSPGPATWVEGARNTLDIVTHASLKALFLRRDSQRCSWRQRAVYLCGPRLFVLESDFFADDVPIESSIDLGAVVIRPFSDEDVLEVTKLQRVGHPNGFEIIEHSGASIRFWLFTCESDKTVQLWLSQLYKVAKQVQRDRLAVALTSEERKVAGAPHEVETTAAATLQALHRANCETPHSEIALDPAGEQKTCEEAHDPEYIYDDLNFRVVADSLRKIKAESRALYDRCFQGDREAAVPRWQVERASNHAAALPHSRSMSVVDGVSDGVSDSAPSPFWDSKSTPSSSAGRYAMPELPLQRSRSTAPRTTVFSNKDVRLPEALPRFSYAPEIKSPRSIQRFFQGLAQQVRDEESCDVLDRH
ncbi:B-box zinc finger domain-containing protein [Babesia caballi]|uniref:B-box zinc finger domain-containing protein n=1 Tax=Babesia caballi TaxID=5871 RepID=A0AAV4LZV0_BABCB|nr:B-box zinc finger domain-containing protein [Babesia caballi]